MSIIDKITGKAKQAAGDVADDPTLRDEGRKEQAKGEAKEDQVRSEEKAAEDRERVDRLEQQT